MSEKPAWTMPLVGQVVSGVVGGGVTGFFLSNFLTVFLFWRNDWGFLKGLLPSMVPREVPFVIVGAVIGGVVKWIKAKRWAEREQARGASYSDFASCLGMTYEPTTTTSQLGVTIPDWQSGAHWYHGDYRGVPSGVVDVTQVHESSDSDGKTSRSTTERTVVLLPREGLPDFDLSPPRWLVVRWLSRGLGLKGIEFDATGATTPSDVEAIRRFERAWHLDEMPTALRTGASNSVKDEATESAVRRLFTPRVMKALEPFAGWSVQASGHRLLLWQGKGFAGAANRVKLLNDAIAIRETLLAGLKSAPSAGLPAPSGGTYSERSRRLAALRSGWTIAGAFLGFALGGIGGQRLVSFLAENRLPPVVLNPAFFGCPILGMVGGVLLGSRFAAHRAKRLAARDDPGAISHPLSVLTPEPDRPPAEPAMTPPSQGRSVLFLLVGVPFLLIGLYLVYRGVSELSGGFRSNSWPSTPGVIHRSEVKVISGGDPGESARYNPKVSYSYRVGQTPYQSERITFGGVPEFGSRADAEDRVADYRVGAAATVFYDPGEPGEAVLEHGTSANAWFQPVFSALFAFVGSLLCGVWLLRPSWNRRSNGRRSAAPGLSSTGLDVVKLDDQRLVLRERRHPLVALVVAPFGLLLATFSVLGGVRDWPNVAWLPTLGFLAFALFILWVSVMLLVEHKTMFDRSTQSLVKTWDFFGLSRSTRHSIAGYRVVRSETVIEKRQGKDGQSTSTSHLVCFGRRDDAGTPDREDCPPTLKIGDAKTGEQARELTRIVGDFLGLEHEDEGERIVDKTKTP